MNDLSPRVQQAVDAIVEIAKERDEWREQADRAGRDLATALSRAVRAEVQRNELLAPLTCIAGGAGNAQEIAKAAIAKVTA